MGEARRRKLSGNYPPKSEKPEKLLKQDILKNLHLHAGGHPPLSSRTLAKLLGMSHEKLVELMEDDRLLKRHHRSFDNGNYEARYGSPVTLTALKIKAHPFNRPG